MNKSKQEKKTGKKWEKDSFYAPIYWEYKQQKGLPYTWIFIGFLLMLFVFVYFERDSILSYLTERGTKTKKTVQPQKEKSQNHAPTRADESKRIYRFDDSSQQQEEIKPATTKDQTVYKRSEPSRGGLKRICNTLDDAWSFVARYKDPCNSDSYWESVLLNMEYSSADIEMFVNDKLPDFSPRKGFNSIFGYYTNMLINNLPEPSEIHLSPDYTLDYIGMDLGLHKPHKVIVNGDVGSHTAKGMRNGHLAIFGNALILADKLMGGRVELYGNVKNVADSALGGSVFVKGNADIVANNNKGAIVEIFGDVLSDAGTGMLSGEVIIHGTAKSVAYKFSGGWLLVKKDVLDDCGTMMKGGHVKILGSSGLSYRRNFVGKFLKGGLVEVMGCVAGVGARSRGGKIVVYGCEPKILNNCKAVVYHKDKLLN